VFYGMPNIVDVLVRSGAVLHDIADYARAGSIPDDVLQTAHVTR